MRCQTRENSSAPQPASGAAALHSPVVADARVLRSNQNPHRNVRRSTIAPDGPHPPARGRYHLYISLACPWACRCLAALHLKVSRRGPLLTWPCATPHLHPPPPLPNKPKQGLQDVIGVSVVHPTWQRTRPDDPADKHTGWAFAAPGDPPLSSSTGVCGVGGAAETALPVCVERDGCSRQLPTRFPMAPTRAVHPEHAALARPRRIPM
jgi:hypothetical protein